MENRRRISSRPLILVVDDKEDIRRMLFHQLRDFGAVIAAEDAETALRIAHEFGVDLVVSDFCMPGMHGVGLLELLSRTHPHSRRLLVSGDTPPNLLSLQSRGILHGFLRKPWDREDLRATAQALLQMRAHAA
jgi:DNA-binding NtrC family response regulator